MERTFITPASEADWLQLRTQDLTSTDLPALFGMSPYKTKLELWHEKRNGQRAAFTETERMKWGTRLEAVVAAGIAEDRGWAALPFKDYGRLPELRLGSSFDFRIDGSGPNDAILEIKTVDAFAFKQGWTVEADFIEAPPHIELQVQHQLLVAGLSRAYIGVLVGGNRIEVIERQADADVHAAILKAAREFWASVEAGTEPSPEMPRDAAFLIQQLQFAEPGKLLDARTDATIASLVARYAELGAQAKAAEEERTVVKAELLAAIGDAEKVLLDGFSVSAGLTGPSLGTLVTPEMVGTYVGSRQGFRNLRVTAKKAKAA